MTELKVEAPGIEPSVDSPLSTLPKEEKGRVIEAEIVSDPSILRSPRVQEILLSMQFYRGPVPPAEQFAAYERAVPGSGMKLIELSSKALDAEIELNRSAQRGDFAEAKRGQWMAYSLAMATVLVGGFVVYSGAEWPGTLLGLGGLATIVYLFIQGKKRT